MAKGGAVSTVAALCVVILVAAAQLEGAAAVTCTTAELKSCAPAIINGSPPTELCCLKLKEQQPCFCKYIHDPSLAPYINNPNAKALSVACGIPFPNCS